MTDCPTCGDEFKNENGMKAHHATVHGESIAGVTITCEYCGEEAEKRQRKARNDHEFCSRDCYNKYQSDNLSGQNASAWEGRTVVVTCDHCGQNTEKYEGNLEKNKKAFCSRGCHAKWQSENKTRENNYQYKPENQVDCKWCGETHHKSDSKLKRNENHFCSNECRGKWQSENRCGENHPRWIENNTTISYGGTWPQKRRERLEKDNHECVVCGKSNAQEEIDTGRGLSVHHIRKARKFIQDNGTLNEEKAHRMENLVTLCHSCHRRWEGIPLKPEIQK